MPNVRHFYDAGWRRKYVDSGTGPETVLFLHGIPTNHVLWWKTIAALGSDRRCVAPDLTGFGLSDLPRSADLSPRGQAWQLLRFLDAIDVESFTLVAHDYGALVATELVALVPGRINGLILLNTSLRVGDWDGDAINPLRVLRIPLLGELAFRCARRWTLRLAFLPFVSERGALDSGLLDAFWEPFERGFSETLLSLWRGAAFNAEDECRWRRALEAFEKPVTIIWGARDSVFRSDRATQIAAMAQSSDLIVLRNSNHFIPIDRPTVLARLVARQVVRNRNG